MNEHETPVSFAEYRNRKAQNPEQPPSEIIAQLNLPRGVERFALPELQTPTAKDHLKQIRSKSISRYKRYLTAAHEWGHGLSAVILGGYRRGISMIPDGNSLARTWVGIDSSKPLLYRIKFFIATAYASTFAEEKVGHHDHRGCGGDLAAVESYAKLGENITRGQFSREQLKSEGRSMAAYAMSQVSYNHIDSLSIGLMDKPSAA